MLSEKHSQQWYTCVSHTFVEIISYFRAVLKASTKPYLSVPCMKFQMPGKKIISFKNLILYKNFPVVLILTCSRAANKYTAIKMGVKEVCPLFIKWIVYKKIRCPGITKRSRTWADLLFTPTIKKKKKKSIQSSVKLFNYYIRFLFISI